MMRRFLLIALGLVATGVFSATASAGPHFVTASKTISNGTLTVSFKEAGLGNTQTVTIQVSATVTATYQCVNNGGNVPKDPKKTTRTTVVSKSGIFTSDKNGNVVGSLTLTAPPPQADFVCPPGQTATLLAGSVTFTNVVITDTTTGAVANP